MNNKTNKIIYFLSTGILSALILLSAGMYFLNHEEISATFEQLGYPAYLVYPLAIAKILGLVAIWSKKSNTLREWAYAGFFFDFVLAAIAHFMILDGEHIPALVAIVLVLVSHIFRKSVK